jgi:hypothetical protein
MNQNIQHHSNAWVTFTYGSFGAVEVSKAAWKAS